MINKITLYLLSSLLILLSLTTMVLIWRNGLSGLFDLLPLLLLLLASAVPVALPSMFTLSTAFGSMELADTGVLLTRSNALEDAARMNVLCLDKTGTITRNRLSITAVTPCCPDLNPMLVIQLGALASQASNRDPIDRAFLREASSEEFSLPVMTTKNMVCLTDPHITEDLLHSFLADTARIEFLPFHPETRRFTIGVLHQHENEENRKRVLIVKGSPLDVFRLCNLSERQTKEFMLVQEEYGGRGWRGLAVAMKQENQDTDSIGTIPSLFHSADFVRNISDRRWIPIRRPRCTL